MNAIPRNSRETADAWNKQDALIFSTLFLTAVEEMLLRAGRMKDRDGAKDWLNVRQGVGLAISDCVQTGCFESGSSGFRVRSEVKLATTSSAGHHNI